MSYNGNGAFVINTTGQPVVTGTVISSTAFNALTADLATGLSTAITKDGQTATTARIPFAAGNSSTLVTDSTSVSPGSIITAGGVGVAKALYVGTTANVAGAATLGSTLTYGGVTLTNAVTGTGKMVLDTNPTISNLTVSGANLSLPVIDNIKMGYTTTATAGGTTTLTVASNYRQFFTGTLAQTIVLPVTSTLVTGMAFEIENNSTGLLTVNSSGGNLVGTIPAGVCAHAVCIGTTLTTAADWDWDYISTSTITGTGANVLGTSPTLVTPALGTPSALVLTNATGLPAAQLTGTQTLPKGTLPTGSVLQIIQSSYNTEFSTTSNTFADTGITASITPTSATSKILVFYSVGYLCQDTNLCGLQLLRGATVLQSSIRAASQSHASYMHNEYLDSPATTSSTTYKIQANKNAGNAFLTCWNAQQPSTITLMEIAA